MINMKSIIFKSINIVCVSIFLLLSGWGDVSDIFNKNNSNNSGNTGGNDNSGNTGSNGDTDSDNSGYGGGNPDDTVIEDGIDISFICYPNELALDCDVIEKEIPEIIEIVEYYWSFGDGGIAEGQYNGHWLYKKGGDYTVKLELEYKKNGAAKRAALGSQKYTLIQEYFPTLFLSQFGDDTSLMYFALHIKGESNIQANGTGLFAQKVTGISGKYSEDYARDLIAYKKGDTNTKFEFSALYQNLGLNDIYSIDYGWTDKDGLKLDMPFYLGYKGFNIPKSSNGYVEFVNFNIVDMTSSGLMPGYDYTSFVRCNTGDFKFNIPMKDYDENFHRNIALFTVNFTGQCAYSVTFDGFLEK